MTNQIIPQAEPSANGQPILFNHLESDSEIAIGGAALLDDHLYTLLSTAFRGSRKVQDEVIGTYGRRKSIAYFVGLISHSKYHDLCTIGTIRNRFAHDVPRPSFESQGIADRCRWLSTWTDGQENRATFVKAVYRLSERLNRKLAGVKRVRRTD